MLGVRYVLPWFGNGYDGIILVSIQACTRHGSSALSGSSYAEPKAQTSCACNYTSRSGL